MPKILVNDKEYKEFIKHERNEQHYQIELVPKECLYRMDTNGFEQPKKLFVWLFSMANIERNTIISHIKWSDLMNYFKGSVPTIQQSFFPLRESGVIKISPELRNRINNLKVH